MEAHVARAVPHPPCAQAAAKLRGYQAYSGAPGCVGARAKWTLALPLSPALRQVGGKGDETRVDLTRRQAG